MTRILSATDVEQLLTMNDVVDWMAEAFAGLSDGTAVVPVRTFLKVPDSANGLLTMPAWWPSPPRYAVKLISLHGENPAKGLPFARATVLVIDSDTGALRAVMDGERLTAVRTGAGSGLATRLMARPDATSVVVLGSGQQAATQLEAVCAVRSITRGVVLSRSGPKGRAFAKSMTDILGIPIRWADRYGSDAKTLLLDADVICTATSSAEPVLSRSDVSSGTHINAVGSHRPDMAELSGDLVASSRVIVDQRAACLVEAGDIIQPINAGLMTADAVAGELGEVVGGMVPGRTSNEEITFFKSVGNGVQDLIVATKLAEKAAALNVGVLVDMG